LKNTNGVLYMSVCVRARTRVRTSLFFPPFLRSARVDTLCFVMLQLFYSDTVLLPIWFWIWGSKS